MKSSLFICLVFFFRSKGFDIKWVDDTHALGVFSSVIAGKQTLFQLNIDAFHN